MQATNLIPAGGEKAREGVEAPHPTARFDPYFAEELEQRAVKAYVRYSPKPIAKLPSFWCTYYEQIESGEYVLVRNHYETLAVYKLRANGNLKRLKKWPGELEPDQATSQRIAQAGKLRKERYKSKAEQTPRIRNQNFSESFLAA